MENGSTSFTLQFTPGAAGARTAALHIASNDSDESPFDINLTGVGVSNTTSPGYQPLAQAEYFVGTDPGQGNGTPLALVGNSGVARDLADITIPVGSLPPGTHSVGVRVKDEAGRWSNPLIRRFTVSIVTLAAGVDPADPNAANLLPITHQPLAQAEYFVGADPGQGNGTPLALVGNSGVARDLADITIPVGSLPPGTHSVGVRVKDEAGRWSNPLIRRFTMSTFTLAGGVDPADPNAANLFPKAHQPLVQAEYFVGADPGQGNGTPLALVGNNGVARDLADITIPVGSLPPGTHSVGVRVKDEAGRWSNPLIRRFTMSTFTLAGGVDPADPNAANLFAKTHQPLVQAEYFVGADPGQGNGTPLALAGNNGVARDLTEVPIPLNMPPGTYRVGVRVKDEVGRWSNALVRRFTLYRTDVIAAQRAGSKLVDLEYDLLDGPRVYTVTVLISNDGGLTWAVPTGSVTGDVGSNVAPGRVKRIVWHAGEDWNNGFSEDMRFRVIAYETTQNTPGGFAAVTPRTFTMGSPVGELGRGGDETERTVVMGKPFFLKATEVTWSEWNSVRNQGTTYGYTDIAAGRNGLNGDGSGNHPVTDVSWLDVVKWCNLRSEIEGRKPVYYSDASLNPAMVVRTGIPTVHALWNANGYRLPTEAEWEAACRAGTTTAFHSGAITDATTDPNLNLAGWYAANSGANTRTVGGKAANALGLYDMHGNVREWCWDAYGSYAAGPQWNPVTGAAGAARVLRGGSWTMAAAACRAAARSSGGQNSRATDIGFRVALNYSGLTDVSTPAGIPVDSRDPAAGNLIAGMRPAINGAVHTAIVLPDGKILIAGDFTMVDGLTRNRLARLNADGTLDAAFNPGADSTVYCAAVLPDGKILLGGDFSSVASGPADFIARLNPDGSLDASFQPGVDYVVRCMVAQPDGKIMIGGDFTLVGGVGRNGVARLLPNGALDVSFNPNANNSVLTLAMQADGKVLLGGAFSMVGGQARNRLARVNADGTLDSGFLCDADGDVTAVSVMASGQVLAGGAFSVIGGQARSGLARLSSAGITDGAFNPGVNGAVHSIAVQANGRVLIGGAFTSVGGINRRRIAAFDAAGALETVFSLDFNGPVHTLSVLPTGKLLVGGTFGTVNGVARQGLAWLDNDATTETLAAMSGTRVRWLRGGAAPEASDVAFELSTDGGVTWLPLGTGMRISGGWERTGVNLPASGHLRARARIPSGRGGGSAALLSSTTTFSGLVTVPEIVVETDLGADVADGGSYAFGTLTMGASKQAFFVIRNIGYGNLTGLTITKDGANPTDFQVTTSPSAPVSGPAGSTNLVIQFTPGDAGARSAAIRIANNDSNEAPFDILVNGTGVVAGQLADAFDPRVNNRVNGIAVQADGQVVIGGAFTNVGGQARGRFARLNSDLSLESTTTFAAGSGANSNVLAVAVQPDRKILLCGQFTTINTQARNRIARVLPDGSLETTATFNTGTGANNTIQALAVQPDGKIVLAGDFTTFNGQPRARIARVHPDGTLEDLSTFNPGTGAGATVNCVAVQSDGGILIGGSFTSVNGQPRQRLARLLADGSLDATFAPDVDNKVSCLCVQPDGKILIGGLFSTVNGEARAGIARLLSTGAVEGISTFDPGLGADAEVTSIALQANRSILVAGSFTLMNNEARAGIARLFSNGTLEDSITFDTVVGPDQLVRGLALRQDGSVIIGGDFIDYNGLSRGRLALLANQSASDELLVADSTRIDWNRGGTAPEVDAVELHLSTDSGATWSPLPALTRKSGGWERAGLALPSSGLIRARGRTVGAFASSSAGMVQVVKPFVNAPTVTTLAATAITTNSAVLNATALPNGTANVRFEYGATTSYGSQTPVQILSGSTTVDVSAPLTGISGLYHFRVIAQTTGGTYYGQDMMFVTAPEPPLAVTANPVAVSTTGATLVGAINPRGRETTVTFEYGATTLYGNTTTPQLVAAANSAVEVTAPLAGLTANATYHYRIVATSSGGTAYGADVSFVANSGGTPTAAPATITGNATDITTTTATINGTVNPNGGFTNAFFEYGTTASLGGITSNLGAGNGTVPVNLSAPLAGLQPGTLYHYRFVAANSLGTVQGSTLTFTTSFLPPTVTTTGSTPVNTTSVRVSGTVRARNASTQVFFDYGTDGINFPNTIAATPAAVTGDVDTPVTADLPNLQQFTTYHYRIRAANSGGTTTGNVLTFQSQIISGLTQQFPSAPPASNGSLTVTLAPTGLLSGWRFAGEHRWRASGDTAAGLVHGSRVIEFRPVPGYLQPGTDTVNVTSTGQVADYEYYATPSAGTGGILVVLKPDTLAQASNVAARGQWRLLGETTWRDSGTTAASLPAGSYLVECKAVSGYSTPVLVNIAVSSGQTVNPTIVYADAFSATGTPPVVVNFSTVSTDSSKPYGYVGQIRSNSGLGTGFAVKSRVVATAAHVVFDEGTLSSVQGLQWLLQEDAGGHEPLPVTPRGYYLIDGYASQRATEATPGSFSLASRQKDVAALYFINDTDAGRTGFAGFLASDLSNNEFLVSNAQKMLVGYPVDGIAPLDQGRMHATPAANLSFTGLTDRVFATTGIRSTGGNSGGPLCVQHTNGNWYPAAIYLGGATQSIVRAIDSTVIQLFNTAQQSGIDDQGYTGGGITHTGYTAGGTASTGALVINITPAGAGWRPVGSTKAFTPGGISRAGLTPGTFSIQFTPLAGYQTPANQSVTVVAGSTQTYSITYQPSQTPQESWRQTHFGTTANSGDAADSADPDGDGFTNAAEYAAGTNPNATGDYFKANNPSRSGSTFSVATAGRSGRTYVLERNTSLTGTWNTVATHGPLTSDQAVTLTDTSSPPGSAFYRIRVTGP